MKTKTAPKDNNSGAAKSGAPAMMNQVTVIGRTCTAIQLRQTATGVVGQIRVAVPGRGGRTSFFTATLWNGSALTAQKHLTVGRLIALQGSLVSNSWVASDGSKREGVSINVERFFFLDKPSKEVA